ncbi:MAG: hypothetical protein H6619_03285 [Deltaproteobacteria bacterium]|nr:hypothetical protein [Deltaproteobacteria bacterium]
MSNSIYNAICDLVSIFNEHKLDYLIGGSISSSLNGIFRTTNDIDVLVEKPLSELPKVVESLSVAFIVNKEMLVAQHSRGRSYNIFHEETALKIDLFPATNDFNQKQLKRAISVNPETANCSFKIATAEDIILAKLQWLKQSDSERQRSDISGVLNTNEDRLDFDYLNRWADKLGVRSELESVKS